MAGATKKQQHLYNTNVYPGAHREHEHLRIRMKTVNYAQFSEYNEHNIADIQKPYMCVFEYVL